LQPRRMANWWDAASRADKAGRVKIQTSLACRSRRTELRQTAAVAKRRGTDGCQHSAGSCSSVDRTDAECFALRHVYGHVFMSDQAKKKKRSLTAESILGDWQRIACSVGWWLMAGAGLF
jgi:hypothetical protein